MQFIRYEGSSSIFTKKVYQFVHGKTTINVTGPRKTPLNTGIPKFIFIVESDKAFSKLQNDRPPSYFLSGDMFEGTLRRYCNALLSK